MTPERFRQIDQLYQAALDQEVEHRSKFISSACAGDVELCREVESLLLAHEQAGSFIVEPALRSAARLLASDQAKSLIGANLAHYQIESILGAGGMGEVYLALDVKLNRKVALKVLPASFNNYTDQLGRFEREAQAASALNHPNIVTIHEIGQMDSLHFIATEFVDGETLREHLTKKRMTVDEVLDVGVQVASALQTAHEAGIVHRDIKPENIMLRRDGIVKVLDFGLAKLTPDQVAIQSQAPTRQMVNTNPSVVMGTVGYMSPEQARGADIDARTDIWSLGVVLYEMISGRAPFVGETPSHIIVSIFEHDPAPLSITSDVPDELQRVVFKALTKNRERRYQKVGDLLTELKRLKQRKEKEIDLPVPVGVETKSWTRPFWAVGILVGLLLLAVSAWYLSRLTTKPGPTQPTLTAIPLTTDPGYEGMPSLSPDGSQVVFGSFGEKLDNLDIYVKQIGGGPPLRLTSDPAIDKYPAWSPDGRLIAFVRERSDKQEVLLIPALGGPERKLAEIAPESSELISGPPYLSWSANSKYLVTVDRASSGEPPSLFVLSVVTGEKRRLTTPPAPALADANPAVSPDGQALAFVRLISLGNTQLFVLPLSEDCRPTGEALRLKLSQPWVTSPAWTADGQEIVCNAGPPWVSVMLWRVPVSDSEKSVFLASLEKTSMHPTFPRQGNRLVYAVYSGEATSTDVWRAEVSGQQSSGSAEKLIASTRREENAQYSPDGSRIAFSSDRSGNSEIWMSNGDGSNPVQMTSLGWAGSPRWFPDGRRIVFDSNIEGHTEIFLIDVTTRVPQRLTNESSDNVTPSVSHDGKWIYFSSTRTGRSEVWRLPAEGGEALQLTHGGGFIPFESADGQAVYYQKIQRDSDVWRVPVAGGEETRVFGPVGSFQFAVTTDGIYFIEPGPPGYAGWIKGNSLKFYSFTKGTAEKVFDIKNSPWIGLSVSPDGRYVLFSQRDPFGLDLMLVENFH